jgi:hypothetical protein
LPQQSRSLKPWRPYRSKTARPGDPRPDLGTTDLAISASVRRPGGPRRARGQRSAGRVRLGASCGVTTKPTRQAPAGGRARARLGISYEQAGHAKASGWFDNRTPKIALNGQTVQTQTEGSRGCDLLDGAVRAHHLLGFVWFDQAQNSGLYHQNWRIDGVPAAMAAFRRAARTTGLRVREIDDGVLTTLCD